MKLAYLLNTYPLTSTTFIRREIEAIEAAGQPVHRFASRRWDQELVDPDDRADQARTEYLLSGNVPVLAWGAITEPFVNPVGLARALPHWWHMYRAEGRGFVRHVNYLLQAIRMRRRAKALGIEHIHAHFSTNATTVAVLTRALGGPTYSFTVHGPDELVEPKRNAMAHKVAHAGFVAAITDYCRGRIVAEAPDQATRVRIVPCGLNLPDFVPSPPPPGPLRHIVCVGRLCANKAQVLIPEALARVAARHPGVTIDLVGDGEDRAAIEEAARRHGVAANIRLLGWASAPEVRRHIADAGALLLPSLAEGLPIVIMEALALERPVLTTIIAGIPELVDDGCGWIFPSGSVDALAEALDDALASPPARRAAMGAEGRRRVEARHDVHKSAALLIAGFREVAGR
ncbi:glycosyltransferase involved in cell wall biosynthesis [Sphingomonas jinjuensis]|uniref:Glycosyltransferase involved in cell wall biosynthesis n=1 Tax=Sphingomonas jinjuensis TaxID=535907 RepID=A0A840FQ84_9SPHN|nr:glycosyltransferase family 4 protein [Sphingomonas jinjuensis]MBB4155435.1 glycosyltransferase involved in cell wall biosynthesis [Sphingomonas jinjuensis]